MAVGQRAIYLARVALVLATLLIGTAWALSLHWDYGYHRYGGWRKVGYGSMWIGDGHWSDATQVNVLSAMVGRPRLEQWVFEAIPMREQDAPWQLAFDILPCVLEYQRPYVIDGKRFDCTMIQLVVPLFPYFVASILLCVMSWRSAITFRLRGASTNQATCLRCGYDLRGSAGPRCPECGNYLDHPGIPG